ERYVNSHLVPVKVSVISCAYERVQSDGAPLYKRCLESLYTKAVQCRRPVLQNSVFLDHFLKYIPHVWVNTFNFSFSPFALMSDSFCYCLIPGGRLVQFACLFAQKAALIRFQAPSGGDHRTT